MKFFIVLALASVAVAAPIQEPAPFELTHTSDIDGSYTFTFSSEDSSKTETRSANGQVTGAYSYLDSNGVLQKYQYVADENGFQVFSTELPVGSTVPVKETPEVLEATAEHFALINKHLKKIAEAKKAHEEYLLAHPEAAEEEKRQVVSVPVEYIHHHVEHHVEGTPMDDEDVKIARAEHLAEVARLTAEHFEAVRNAPKLVEEEEHTFIHHVVPTVEYHHVVHHDEEELPVPPMDDEDVMIAKAEHLAEVARIKAEHHQAFLNAPKLVEEEEHVEYVPVEYVYQYVQAHEDEVPVAPEQDDDVKIATAEHLAEVERIKQEHAMAFADALRYAKE